MIRKIAVASIFIVLMAAFVGISVDVRGDRTGISLSFAFWDGSMAQSIIAPFSITCNNTNPGCAFDVHATDPAAAGGVAKPAIHITCTYNDIGAPIGFTDQICLYMEFFANNGQNSYASGTNAKRTFLPVGVVAKYPAAGQKFLYGNTLYCYGMGDCGVWGNNRVEYAGGATAGDEGLSWQTASGLNQQSHLSQFTVASVARTACNTTITQVVGAAPTVQTVTVASTAGCNVGDWLAVDTTLPYGYYGFENSEGVQITAVGSGTISGIFKNNHGATYSGGSITGTTLTLSATTGGSIQPNQVVAGASPGTVFISCSSSTTCLVNNSQSVSGLTASYATAKPALALTFAGGTGEAGQQRKLVNLSGSSHSTGMVSTISGAEFTGSGTAWSAGMVGGDATNIGCISLTADIYDGPAVNGQNFTSTPLNSWYEITSVIDSTHLYISSLSTANDQSYHGLGPGSGGYVIRPCVEMLSVDNVVVGESTSTTWSVSDNVEAAISPYPDVTGWQNYMAMWTPGGAHRGFMYVRNNGAREFGFGFSVESALQVGSNADTVGWGTAYNASGVERGLAVSGATQSAIALDASAPSGTIVWGSSGDSNNMHIVPNVANGGLDFQLDHGGPYPTSNSSYLRSYGHNSGILGAGGSMPALAFGGAMGTAVHVYADLPMCAPAGSFAGYEGLEMAIRDSNSGTFGATITGTGPFHVKAYCNGSNWKVD